MDFTCQSSVIVRPREYVTCVRALNSLILAATTDAAVRLASYDAETLAPLFTFPMTTSSKLTGIAPSTDTVVMTCFEDGTVCLYDIRQRNLISSVALGKYNDTQCIATSPDGIGMTCIGDAAFVVIADMRQQKVVSRVENHSDSVTALAWSPDNPHVFCTGGEDGLVNVIDLCDGEEIRAVIPLEESLACLTFAPSGVIYGSTTLENCFVALADSGDIISRLCRRDEATYVADVPLIGGGGDAFVVMGRHGEEHERVCGDVELWTFGPPSTVVASMSGRHGDIVRSVCQVGSGGIMPYVRLATGSEDGRIAVWGLVEQPQPQEVAPSRASGRVSGGRVSGGGAKPYYKK